VQVTSNYYSTSTHAAHPCTPLILIHTPCSFTHPTHPPAHPYTYLHFSILTLSLYFSLSTSDIWNSNVPLIHLLLPIHCITQHIHNTLNPGIHLDPLCSPLKRSTIYLFLVNCLAFSSCLCPFPSCHTLLPHLWSYHHCVHMLFALHNTSSIISFV